MVIVYSTNDNVFVYDIILSDVRNPVETIKGTQSTRGWNTENDDQKGTDLTKGRSSGVPKEEDKVKK